MQTKAHNCTKCGYVKHLHPKVNGQCRHCGQPQAAHRPRTAIVTVNGEPQPYVRNQHYYCVSPSA